MELKDIIKQAIKDYKWNLSLGGHELALCLALRTANERYNYNCCVSTKEQLKMVEKITKRCEVINNGKKNK